MRLPTDATLLFGDGADPELARVWREERLPVLTVPALDRLGGGTGGRGHRHRRRLR